MQQMVAALRRAFAFFSVVASVLACDNAEPDVRIGRISVIDSLTIDQSDLGTSVLGIRLVSRGDSLRFYVMDDELSYVEFAFDSGDQIDSIDFAPYFTRNGFSDDVTVSSVVWPSDSIALLTVIEPTRSFYAVDLRKDSLWKVERDWVNDKLAGLWAFANPSSTEQKVVEQSVLTGVQPLMSGTNDDVTARHERYRNPPLVRFVMDSALHVTKKIAIGHFPDYYKQVNVVIQGWSFDLRESIVCLAFESGAEMFYYDFRTGEPVDLAARFLPVNISPKRIDPGEMTPQGVRRLYFESSRAPIVKFFGSNDILRTFVQGRPLGRDSIVTREYDKMDWSIFRLSKDGKSITRYDVNGEWAQNTFLEVHDSTILLRASNPPVGYSTIYKCRFN
jgi:hypothetical protein